jgi:hypothetical protein
MNALCAGNAALIVAAAAAEGQERNSYGSHFLWSGGYAGKIK